MEKAWSYSNLVVGVLMSSLFLDLHACFYCVVILVSFSIVLDINLVEHEIGLQIFDFHH
jgi:hypothetical protein